MSLFSEHYGNGLDTQDYDWTLKLGEKRKDFSRVMKENLKVEEELRKKAEEQLETRGAKLEGDRAELKAVQAELAQLKEKSSKCREDALMEISRLQARVDDIERKLAGVPKEIAAARTAALAEYRSSAEFKQVWSENFDEGVRTFIYNVWRKHLE